MFITLLLLFFLLHPIDLMLLELLLNFIYIYIYICEFPIIFLKIMVHFDLGSVQKLRPHLVDAKK